MSDPRDAFREAVAAGLGYAPDVIEPGRFQRFATTERRGDAAGWCKLFDDMRGGVYGCYRQGISETWSACDRAAMSRHDRAALGAQVLAATVEREVERRQQWAFNAQRLQMTWRQCVGLSQGDAAALYLQRRGFAGVWPLPSVLRFHAALPYWHDGAQLGTFPALVAPIVGRDGSMVALHRTFLTTDGRKADVPSPKKLTGAAGPTAGACVPLFAPVRGCMGIAEGIETALAACYASQVPTVAAYCAAGVAAWQWPAGLRQLMIFADADRVGQAAAGALHARAVAAGLHCDVHTPSDDGADWCDVWAASADRLALLDRSA